MKLQKRSMISGKVNEMDLDITLAQIDAWNGGMLIQHAFPNLSQDQREFLLTGSTPEEWATLEEPEE